MPSQQPSQPPQPSQQPPLLFSGGCSPSFLPFRARLLELSLELSLELELELELELLLE